MDFLYTKDTNIKNSNDYTFYNLYMNRLGHFYYGDFCSFSDENHIEHKSVGFLGFYLYKISDSARRNIRGLCNNLQIYVDCSWNKGHKSDFEKEKIRFIRDLYKFYSACIEYRDYLDFKIYINGYHICYNKNNKKHELLRNKSVGKESVHSFNSKKEFFNFITDKIRAANYMYDLYFEVIFYDRDTISEVGPIKLLDGKWVGSYNVELDADQAKFFDNLYNENIDFTFGYRLFEFKYVKGKGLINYDAKRELLIYKTAARDENEAKENFNKFLKYYGSNMRRHPSEISSWTMEYSEYTENRKAYMKMKIEEYKKSIAEML